MLLQPLQNHSLKDGDNCRFHVGRRLVLALTPDAGRRCQVVAKAQQHILHRGRTSSVEGYGAFLQQFIEPGTDRKFQQNEFVGVMGIESRAIYCGDLEMSCTEILPPKQTRLGIMRRGRAITSWPTITGPGGEGLPPCKAFVTAFFSSA
jgi:hypothetical protein